MQKIRKICLRLTTHRSLIAALAISSVVNVIIVGAAFGVTFQSAAASSLNLASPANPFVVPITGGTLLTFSPTQTIAPTQSMSNTPSLTLTSTGTFTQTPSATPTVTLTATFTHTPSITPCVPQYAWSIYIVQSGDTFSHIARITSSTVNELMQANCMMATLLFPGQRLYVPRLPIETPTFTPTAQAMLCIDMEDLTPGTIYKSGETFTSTNVRITVAPFEWSNGEMTSNGTAYVTTDHQAGGIGGELQVNNVNLFIDPFNPPSIVSLLFGEYGGNLNIDINGDFRNFENFADIHGLEIGGAKVSVLQGFGSAKGYLQLSGVIETFGVGGQELSIDNVCLSS